MIKKTINIPIYHSKLTIIYDKDLSYVNEKYGTEPLTNYGGIAMRNPYRFGHYIVSLTYKNGSIIAHEVVHLVNYIFQDRGIELDRNNDEPQAYLTGWLFEQIDNFLKNK